MIERWGFPHPGPLPAGEGVFSRRLCCRQVKGAHGASATVSPLILAPMHSGRGKRGLGLEFRRQIRLAAVFEHLGAGGIP
jgi:hypothetical protein